MKTGEKRSAMFERARGGRALCLRPMLPIVVGIVMALVLGACGAAPAATAVPGAEAATAAVTASALPTKGTATGPTAQPTLSAEERAQLIALLAEKSAEGTRHFLGAPDAPVTIIEFSDYQ